MQAVAVYSNNTVDKGQTSSFDVMVTSADSNPLSIVSTSACGGDINLPDLPWTDEPAHCKGGIEIARNWLSSSLGAVLGKAFEEDEVLMSALKAIFGASLGGILSSGGVMAALLLAVIDALWETSGLGFC